MSTPPAPDEPLQFDEADFGTEAPLGPACSICRAPIADRYYEVSGQVVCEPCRDRMEATTRGGSRAVRLFKATAFGLVAAALGAVLYYAIVRATDMNFGLVAVVVGLMVGGAVRSGSGHRGGWGYQLLAVGLTYLAIAGMIAPFLISSLAELEEQQEQQEQKQEDEAIRARIQAMVDEAEREGAEPEAKAEAEAADRAPAEKGREAGPETAAAGADGKGVVVKVVAPPENDPTIGQIVLAIAAMAAFGLALPVMVGIGHPISGLIYTFALWEAWKINRRTTLAFNGPYHVTTPSAGEPADEDDGHGA